MTEIVRSCMNPYYIQLVFEYLLHMGLLNTAKTLKEECNAKQYSIPNYIETQIGRVFNLLKHFDNGEQATVLKALDSTISHSKQSSLEYKKLVADLHIYFASRGFTKSPGCPDNMTFDIIQDAEESCTPQRSVGGGNPKIIIGSYDDNASVRSSLVELATFLEEKCANLRGNPEFMSYFSLPYDSNPITHDLFGQALQATWANNLRRKLEEYISLHYLAVKVPEIVLELPSNIEHNLRKNYPQPDSDETEEDKPHIVRRHFSHQDTHDIELDDVDSNLEGDMKCPDSDSVEEGPFHVQGSSFNEDNFGNEEAESKSVHTHRNSVLFFKRRHKTRSMISSEQTERNPVSTSESSSTDQVFQEYKLSYSRLKENFSQLHSDYHNLIGVTTELTGALEHSVRGQEIDLRETLNNCSKIFPELFSHNFHQKKVKNKATLEKPLGKSTGYECRIHIARVKTDLLEGNMKTRLLLLQALRWAITKSTLEQREYTMGQLIIGDLLNIQGDFLLKSLLFPPSVETPHPLQQSAARLLNTMASVQSGRSYLAQNSMTVNVASAVMQQLYGISIDTITKNMLMAALQKLSLRRNQRIAMIELGMVEWLFQELSVVESSYSLEYGTALLMNLCLHLSAKERCVPIAQFVINLLLDLLSTPVIQAIPYINGTLYSLLAHPHLNEMAAKAGMSKALEKNLRVQKNDEIRKQFEHILQFHQSLLSQEGENSVLFTVCEGEMIDEDSEELDLLGEELDEQDPVRSISGDLIGEDLLRAHYTLPAQSYGYDGDGAVLKRSRDSFTPLRLRPTTPHHSEQNTSEDSDGVVVGRKFNGTNRKKSPIGTNNQHLKRIIINQQSIGEEQSRCQSVGTGSKMIIRSGHEAVTGNFKTVDMRGNPGAKNFNTSISDAEKKTKLPDLSLHSVETDDAGKKTKCYNNDDDDDDDSKDVLIGSLPNVDIIHEQNSNSISQHIMEITAENRDSHDPASKNENGNTAAFASRPKIPRTPPHHI